MLIYISSLCPNGLYLGIASETQNNIENLQEQLILPRRGTASEVAGIVSATMFRKTVRDKRIVTPVEERMRS